MSPATTDFVLVPAAAAAVIRLQMSSFKDQMAKKVQAAARGYIARK